MKRSASRLLSALDAESTRDSINKSFYCIDVRTAFGNLISEEELARLWTIYYLKKVSSEILRICVCLSYCNK
jgi:hypothetical protein